MKMRVIGSFVGSIAITLVTGWIQGFLLYAQGGLHVITGPILGATNYGLPIVWRSVIVYPGSPTCYNLVGFFVDLVIWALAVWLVLSAQIRRKQ